jgi:D-alanyl-D-alanine carboxypeptidase
VSTLVATALVIGIVSGCAGSMPASGASLRPAPAVTTGPAAVPPTVRPSAFPTGAFTALRDVAVPEGAARDFQETLDDMARGGAIAATVITPDGTWSGASGKADGVHDVSVDSQFGIGSVTKSVVAAQVMQLVQAGEVALDAPATEHLPHDFMFDTNGATIRQLLSHRSGIPDWYAAVEQRMAVERTRAWEPDDVFALVGAARRPVGTFEYADTNYNLLGLAIEHVRQRPLVDVLRDGVLRVEGTERLIYQPDEAPTEPLAMPRGESGDALEQGGGYLPSVSDASASGPAGGMASDSVSLARWWRALCAGEIVSETALTEMSTFHDGEYGLGVFNPNRLAYGPGMAHLGANFGYRASAGCLTESRLVFAVLTNDVSATADLATPLIKSATR